MSIQSGVPVIMAVAGDSYIEPCRIGKIIWEGATTAADTVEINWRLNGLRIWKGRASGTQTYLDVDFGIHGVPAPEGFRLTQISAGSVAIYLAEV
jgi:hypothetical protein